MIISSKLNPKKPMPVVFSVNDYFIPYTAAMIQSVMENADQGKQYIIYILYQNISDENINLLRKQISSFPQFSMDFINVTQYFDKKEIFISRHVSVETYFRLLIPYLFCEYKTVVYLDGDMICRTDIAALFEIDMENNILAAVRDTDVSRYLCPRDEKRIKRRHTVLPYLKEPTAYFNAGLIVFNTHSFSQTISLEQLLKLVVSRKWQVHDQDVLNFLAEGKVLLLPYHWNYMYAPRNKYLPQKLKTEYIDAERNPKIIHFKPWERDSYIPFFEYFWKYSSRTPFIDVIIERMKLKELISFETSIKDKIFTKYFRRKKH